jgi:NADPH-dependent 2,4-dienoyl-CoA reductase/sulfur reductase-like enzyme
MGNDDFASAVVHPRDWYRDHDVDLRLGRRVTTIDPAARTVTAGRSIQEYDKLLLVTGALPRRLPMADDSGAPVTYLRTVEDSDRIKSELRLGRRLVIVGGGWIGLEVAAAARIAGAHVTVLEALDLPLVGVLGPEVAAIFGSLHTARGVDLRVEAKISSIEGDDRGAIVNLADGSRVEADLLVVGIGALPETSLGRTAGLRTNNGIVVDQYLRTSELDIYAAGDVANVYHPLLDRHVRVEHWDNAIRQGVVAAQNMMGHVLSYDQLPYFYSDQYDLGMEYVGNVGPDGYDRVIIRGKPEKGTFTAFWLKAGRVLAGMHANDWDAMDPIRRIVGQQRVVAGLDDECLPLARIAGNLD